MNHPVFPVPATPAEAVRLLDAPLEALLDSASALRERHHGKRISLCAIINARSGDCGMDCRFCSQSSHNHTPIAHFPFLEAAELRERILRLAAWPVRRIGWDGCRKNICANWNRPVCAATIIIWRHRVPIIPASVPHSSGTSVGIRCCVRRQRAFRSAPAGCSAWARAGRTGWTLPSACGSWACAMCP